MFESSAKDAICFESEFSANSPAFLKDYQLQGAVMLPAAAYLEMALAATKALGDNPYFLAEVDFCQALFLPKDDTCKLQFILTPEGYGNADFQIWSQLIGMEAQQKSPTLHARGKLLTDNVSSLASARQKPLSQIQTRCLDKITGEQHYQNLYNKGLQCGLSFQGLKQIWRCEREALGWLQLPQALELEVDTYEIHPAFLEACLQVLVATLPEDNLLTPTDAYLPLKINRLRVYHHPNTQLWSYAILRQITEIEASAFEGDVYLLDESGQLVAEVLGLSLQSLSHNKLQNMQAVECQQWNQPNWTPKVFQLVENWVAEFSASSQIGSEPTQDSANPKRILGVEPEEGQQLLEFYLLTQVARVMEIPPSRLDVQQPLQNLGLDSLMVLELESQLEGDLGVSIPLENLLSGISLKEFTMQVFAQMKAVASTSSTGTGTI